MNKKNFMYAAAMLLLAGSLAMTSCSDDDVSTSQVTMNLNIKNNSSIGNDLTINDGTYTFTNISTGTETRIPYGATSSALQSSTLAQLTDGLYNVSFIGTGKYTYTETVEKENENGKKSRQEVTKNADASIQGSRQNVQVTGGNVNLTLDVYVQNKDAKGNFVIAEIFSGGTLNATTGKQYNGDQYIRIYNNSDEMLYADGLMILESEFMTTIKFDYTPDIMDKAFAVQVIAVVPGSGKDYPVAPGKEIIICDNAIDHRAANAGSINLNKANFEWYVVSSIPTMQDVDNPDVPNLNMLYNYTASIWILTKQGNRAYAIARLPKGMTTEKYLTDYKYTYHYTNILGNQTPDRNCYQVPNEWILDAVNLGAKNKYIWNLTSNVLDMGYTYLGENATIAENVGHSVVRKISYTTENGRAVLQDTNNSSVDFIPGARATLLPAQ